MKFFVWLSEQQHGPFDEKAIQRMIEDGVIVHETLMRPEEGEVTWVQAKDLFASDPSPENTAERANADSAEGGREQPEAPRVQLADNGARVTVRLASGLHLKIKAIQLYDEAVLAELNSMRSRALKKIHGVSTAGGTVDGDGWALAASAALSTLAVVLAANAASSGMDLLTEVMRMEQRLRSGGLFLPVGMIQNIENPAPGLWRVPFSRPIRVQTGTDFWTSEKKYESREAQAAYIHSGHEFIFVEAEDGVRHSIRWEAVDDFVYIDASLSP
jgi:hypothetical protein